MERRPTPGISERRGSTTTYQLDGLKSTLGQIDANGGHVSSRNYDAFGAVTSSSGNHQGPFGYGGVYGYQTDPDTGLMLLGHRYYDSSTGRFLTRDPIKDGRNWYGYGGGFANPVNGADPNGLAWHDPMVIYVHPDFAGTVIVVGEPGPGKPQGAVVVPPGHHSNPRMDVDYVYISYPDGRRKLIFAMGLPYYDGRHQLSTIDSKGNLHTDGPIMTDRDWPVSYYLCNMFSKALNNMLSDEAPAIRGRFYPVLCPTDYDRTAPRLYPVTRRSLNAASPRLVPVGSKRGSHGSLISE